MQELIEILEGLHGEFAVLSPNPQLMAYLTRCIEIAKTNANPEETQEQLISRMRGKIEAYEYALKCIKF